MIAFPQTFLPLTPLPMKALSAQKYVAELLGTFFLTFAISLSLLMDLPLSTPLIAGFTLGLFVYTIGDISGAHLNPAVTIGMLAVNKISVRDTILYIIFQCVGALLAMLSYTYVIPPGTVRLVFEDTASVALAEAVGAFIFIFGVSAVVYKRVNSAASGIVIGSSLMLGIILTAGLSHGVLNPAVALGMGSTSLIYFLAPIAGGFLAAQMYRFLQSK